MRLLYIVIIAPVVGVLLFTTFIFLRIIPTETDIVTLEDFLESSYAVSVTAFILIVVNIIFGVVTGLQTRRSNKITQKTLELQTTPIVNIRILPLIKVPDLEKPVAFSLLHQKIAKDFSNDETIVTPRISLENISNNIIRNVTTRVFVKRYSKNQTPNVDDVLKITPQFVSDTFDMMIRSESVFFYPEIKTGFSYDDFITIISDTEYESQDNKKHRWVIGYNCSIHGGTEQAIQKKMNIN